MARLERIASALECEAAAAGAPPPAGPKRGFKAAANDKRQVPVKAALASRLGEQ